MRFDSKAHMVQELLKGKRFRRKGTDVEIYYDEDFECPFRLKWENGDYDTAIDATWGEYNYDIWEEVVGTKGIEGE